MKARTQMEDGEEAQIRVFQEENMLTLLIML
jgi:hypothetical protein